VFHGDGVLGSHHAGAAREHARARLLRPEDLDSSSKPYHSDSGSSVKDELYHSDSDYDTGSDFDSGSGSSFSIKEELYHSDSGSGSDFVVDVSDLDFAVDDSLLNQPF
jgi:hypothetical protein